MKAAVEGRLPRGVGVARLRDAPAEWSRQYAMLGHRELPPAAVVGLRHGGTPDVVAVFRSVVRQPRQLPALARTALDARITGAALRCGRRLLGAGLGFPYFSDVAFEVALR